MIGFKVLPVKAGTNAYGKWVASHGLLGGVQSLFPACGHLADQGNSDY